MCHGENRVRLYITQRVAIPRLRLAALSTGEQVNHLSQDVLLSSQSTVYDSN